MKKGLIYIATRQIVSALFVMVSVTAAFGQDNYGGGRLAGTWDAVVTIRVCANGAPITSFQSVGSFNQGGTFSGITSGLPPTLRTSERGVWRHINGNVYLFRFKAYLYNPAAVAVGYQVVTHELELDPDGLTYKSGGTSQTFDMNGTQTGAGCSTAVGTRMTLD